MTEQSEKAVVLTRGPALVGSLSTYNVATPPLGMAYLSAVLQKHGVETVLIDTIGESLDSLSEVEGGGVYAVGLTVDQLLDRMPAPDQVDIVGFSCMFSMCWPNDRKFVEAIKRRYPDAIIVAGGEHVTACPEYLLESCPEVTLCVLGEGEMTMVEVVQALRAGLPLEEVPGIVYRNEDGQAVKTKARPRLRQPDVLPWPDWDQVPLEEYFQRGLGNGVSQKRNMPLLATRGCPYQCTFCSNPRMWTTRWVPRSPKDVVDEMEHYVQRYNVDCFDLYDLTAVIKKKWAVEFATEIIDRGLDITYQLGSGTRSEQVDAEVCDLFRRSGMIWMACSPESASEQTLKRIKKHIKLDALLNSIKVANESGLNVQSNIILFPDDTYGDVLRNFRFAIKAAWAGATDMTLLPFSPYPGTELYDQLVEQGRLPPPSEEFFVQLMRFQDMSKSMSFNPRFPHWSIPLLRYTYILHFFAWSFLFRPSRLVRLIRNVFKNAPTTRLEWAVANIARRAMKVREMKRA